MNTSLTLQSRAPLWRALGLPDLDAPLPSFGSLDAAQTPNAYEMRMDLPGLAKSDVALKFQHGVLKIEVTRSEPEALEEGSRWLLRERQAQKFTRALRLPPDADGSAISAKLDDGVLSISVPRRSPDEGRIDIN